MLRKLSETKIYLTLQDFPTMFIFICIFFLIGSLQSQELAWIGGSISANKFSEIGSPSGRSGTGVWQGGGGTGRTVWMFGGIGLSVFSASPVLLNDVWAFSLDDKSWKEVHPGTVSNLTVVTYRAPQIPQPRQLMAACGTGLVMVMFGGLAEDDQALGDLWVFDTEKKSWRLLVESFDQDPYQPPLLNNTEDVSRDIGPSPRGDSAVWCTSTHLYLFGGRNETGFILGDMWRLSLQDFSWEELKSSKDAPAALRNHFTANYPSARHGAMTWLLVRSIDAGMVGRSKLESSNSADETGDTASDTSRVGSDAVKTGTSINTTNADNTLLFMFGGNILSKSSSHIATGFTSDMWQYDISSDSWHYLVGSTQPGQPAVYGHLSEERPFSIPGCRRGAATWTDAANFLWMFGGEGADKENPSESRSAKLLSDLWRFHPQLRQWVWMRGSQHGDASTVIKEKDELSSSAVPGGRVDSAAWADSEQRRFFMFGGLGHDGEQRKGFLSDLWLVDASITFSDNFYIPAIYGLAAVLTGTVLVLCLAVVAMYARDRSKAAEWRHNRRRHRYNLLQDSDT